MRIVNVMLGKGLGGIEQATVDYCEAMRLCGHETHAVIHPHAAIRAQLDARDIPAHTLANLGAWDPLATLKLRHLLRRLGSDACIAHGNRAISLLLHAAPESRVAGVLHNYKIKTDGLADIFYPTEDLRRHAEEKSGGAQKRYHAVPNMVRVPAEFPLRRRHEPPVIGAMGRFVAKKGFDVFIAALGQLKRRDIAFSAVLAGDGEEQDALRNRVLDEGLSEHVQLPGWIDDKSQFFDAIDLFCLPSLHEPFGIALIEAMAHGAPVVAAASEGPSEIIADGEDGVLVPPGDVTALADALADMLYVPPRAELLARNAFTKVKVKYDVPVIAGKLDLALHSLCRV